MPSYPEIRVAVRPGPKIARMIDDYDPDALHIATEGPLGWAARRRPCDAAAGRAVHQLVP